MHDRDRDQDHDHDRGLAHDLRTMSRRRMFVLVGGAAAASAIAACSTNSGSTNSGGASGGAQSSTQSSAQTPAASATGAAPAETAGPYPGDGSNGPNILIQSGVVRRDVTASFGGYSGTAEGVPMTLKINLKDLVTNAAGAGMAVYVWHCDRSGEYSLYGNATQQNYLRGVQVADANGLVQFTSIFPACYDGRWPHIHFEVFDTLAAAVAGDQARLTSQIALPEEVCKDVFAGDSGYSTSVTNLARVSLATDGVFGDGWDAELASVSGDAKAGVTAEIAVGVADKSQNQSSGMGGPKGGGSGGAMPPGPPPGR